MPLSKTDSNKLQGLRGFRRVEGIAADHFCGDLGTVPAESVGCFNLIFYSSVEDAI